MHSVIEKGYQAENRVFEPFLNTLKLRSYGDPLRAVLFTAAAFLAERRLGLLRLQSRAHYIFPDAYHIAVRI